MDSNIKIHDKQNNFFQKNWKMVKQQKKDSIFTMMVKYSFRSK